jgi:hypothetical protein
MLRIDAGTQQLRKNIVNLFSECLGDVIQAEIISEQRWVLSPEGEEVNNILIFISLINTFHIYYWTLSSKLVLPLVMSVYYVPPSLLLQNRLKKLCHVIAEYG